MENFKKDWTHPNVEITDIRKLSQLYVLTIKSKEINKPLFVKTHIFEDRLKSFFLVDYVDKLSRSDVLTQRWNMYITKGFFIKIRDGIIIKHDEKTDPDKYYVSFLEIDGALGSFESVYKEKNN